MLQERRRALTKYPAECRGRTDLEWLHSRHTFSFGGYFQPENMGFRALRVLNDDIVEPGQGFATHGHHDIEIISYVIEGELQHHDSLGNGSLIKAGDFQYISAGSGIRHSEFNPSRENRVHFLQIWLTPNETGGTPRYAEKTIGTDAGGNSLSLLFAGEPRDGAVQIRQDAEISLGKLGQGCTIDAGLGPSRHAWVHVVKGQLEFLGEELGPGDGAAISNAPPFAITARVQSEFLLFNLG
jgi:quercetin 2,3-dioxygenase